jgi:hypothetical protein
MSFGNADNLIWFLSASSILTAPAHGFLMEMSIMDWARHSLQRDRYNFSQGLR